MEWFGGVLLAIGGGFMWGVCTVNEFYKKKVLEGKLFIFDQEVYKFTKVGVKDEAN